MEVEDVSLTIAQRSSHLAESRVSVDSDFAKEISQ